MIALIVTIAVVGCLAWAITTFIPMPAAFKTAIIVIAVVCLICLLLRAFGVWGVDLPVPQVR